MNMKSLYEYLSDLNIRIKADEGKLLVDAPKGVITSEVSSFISINKIALLAYLTYQGRLFVKTKNILEIRSVQDKSNIITSFAQQRLWFIDQLQKGSS